MEINRIIADVAAACAAEAARAGSPAQGRGLAQDEDADRGDYERLDEALGREASREERARFRAEFSGSLTKASESRRTSGSRR